MTSLEALLAAQEGGGRGGGRGRGGGSGGKGGKGGKGKGGGGGGGGWSGGKGGRKPTWAQPCQCFADDLPQGESLLGAAPQFCDAFFHVRETPEAELPLCCVRQPRAECEGRNTVIVARLVDSSGAPVLLARFTNRDKHHHAELVMMQDHRVLAALHELRAQKVAELAGGEGAGGGGEGEGEAPVAAGRLTVYISLQPCHHSSGNTSLSCTEDLFTFHAAELAPRPAEAPAEAGAASTSPSTSPTCPPPADAPQPARRREVHIPLELVIAYPYRPAATLGAAHLIWTARGSARWT